MYNIQNYFWALKHAMKNNSQPISECVGPIKALLNSFFYA